MASLALSAGTATAQAPGERRLVVARRGPAEREGAGGEVTSLLFQVQAAVAVRDATTRVALPPGWRLLAPDGPLSLAAGASTSRLLSVVIPVRAIAGRHVIRYEVDARGLRAADSATIVVAARREVTASVGRAPAAALADSTFVVSFAVRNEGNVPVRLAARVRSRAGFATRVTAAPAALAPGATALVTAEVETRRPTRRPATTLVERVDLLLDLDGVTATAPLAAASVRVYPMPGRWRIPYHALPGALTVHASPSAQGAALAELWLRGPVRTGSATEVELLARRAARVTATHMPFVNEANELTLRLRGAGWRLGLGDQSAPTAPLTQGQARGTGVSAFAEHRWLRAGVVALRDTRTLRPREERALSLGVGPRRFWVGLTMLDRAGAVDSGRALTARAELRLPLNAVLAAEQGIATDSSGATAIDLRGGSGGHSFALRHVAADARYPSALRGRTRDDGYLSLRLVSALRLEGSAYRQASADGSPLIGTDGAGWRAGALLGGTLGVEGFGRLVEGNRTAGIRERGLRGRLHRRVGPLSLTGTAARSLLDSGDVALPPLPAARFTARAELRFSRGALVLSGDHMTRGILGQRVVGETQSLFAQAQVEPRRGTWLDAGFTSRVSEERQFDDAAVDLRIRQRLLFAHEVELRARQSIRASAWAPREPQLLVSYRVPLAVPVGRTRGVSGVDVVLRGTEPAARVGGVLLRLGDQTALTDDEGRASFPALAPGRYLLEGDIAAHGLVLAEGGALPLPVDASGGSQRRVELATAPQSRLAVRLRLDADGGEPGSDAGLSRIVVIASQGRDTLTRRAGADGRATFDGLRAGAWTISVRPASLPAHHRVSAAPVVPLASGETREVELQIVPVARRMIVVAEQELRLPAPAGPLAPHYYVVRAGERTLAAAAHWLYGDASQWPRLWAVNRSVPGAPYHLTPGMLLLVPPASVLTDAERALLQRHEEAGCSREPLGDASPACRW